MIREESDTIKMTDEEMIDTLKGLVFGTFDRTTPKEREALDLAIKLLEKEKQLSDDYISRQDAIGIVARIKEMHIDDRERHQINYGTICDIDLALQQLPSVTPKTDVISKIRTEIESQRKEVSNKHSENNELQAFYDGLNDGLKDARDIIDRYNVESEE